MIRIAPRAAGLVAIFAVAWVAVGVGLLTEGWQPTWEALGVPSMWPPFADMRTVQGAVESLERGLDPQLVNPGDPWGRAMNYPLAWAAIAQVLGLGDEARYLAVVGGYVGIFLLACGWIVVRARTGWALPLVLSGAALFAVERGNNDLLVFLLLFAAAWLPLLARGLLVLLAGALKVYPLALFPLLMERRRRGALLLALFVLVLLMLWPELGVMRAGNSARGVMSYGGPALAAAVRHVTGLAVPAPLLLAGLLGAGLALARRLPADSAGPDEPMRRMFELGAATYLATYLLASNWDYRLVMVLLCLPQLASLGSPVLRHGTLAMATLALNEIALTALLVLPGALLAAAAKAALFVALAALLLLSVAERSATLRRLVVGRAPVRV